MSYHCVLSNNGIFIPQLKDKFEHLKRLQLEKTRKLEQDRRQLEEEIIDFYKRKVASETLQTQVYTNMKKEKERKKQSSLTDIYVESYNP